MKRSLDQLDVMPSNDAEITDILSTIDELCQLDPAAPEPEEKEDLSPDFELTEAGMAKRGFHESQIQEVMLGIRQGLPAEVYARDCYNWKQMREIRLGLRDGLDTTLYEEPLFSAGQMREIRLGLRDGLDVSSYAGLMYATADMSLMRRKLLSAVYREEPEGFGREILDEESQIRIRISDDAMKAYITLPEQSAYTIREIKKILINHEIVHGIQEDKLRNLVQQKAYGRETLVAEGNLPQMGEDGHFHFFFNKLLPESPKVHEDGSVDYTGVVVADKVKKGQVLARYHRGYKGNPGETVTGVYIEGGGGKKLPPFSGVGFSMDEETGTYTAATDGYVVLDEDQHILSVQDVLLVEGDVNRYNGNITYDGIVQIKGSVSDMAVITASGDVIVEGAVAGAEIKAGANVIIKGGVNANGNGHIQAGGKVMANFFEYANIEARGRIEANYFLNCIAQTDNILVARGSKARIMGGEITAARAVESVIIGNYGEKSTTIDVGNVSWIEKRMLKYQQEHFKVNKECRQLTEGKKKLTGLLGDDISASNALYQKICRALEVKEQRKTALEWEIDYFTNVKNHARHAYVKASGGIREGVTVILNGKRQVIEEVVWELSLAGEHQRKRRRRKPS